MTDLDPRSPSFSHDSARWRGRFPARRRGTVLAGTAVVALVGLLGGACSSDSGSDEAGPADESVVETTVAEATTTTVGGPQTVEITAADYAFAGVPDSVAAGSTISLTTAPDGEPHEVVAVALPDTETRPAGELVALPDDEFGALFAEEAALVTIALPGTTDTPGPVVGDGTLDEPGRYLLLCTFPQGTSVADVEAATGPLEGDQRHYTLGMFTELLVE